MESNMVIKVKYGDILRRFNARINENDQLDLDMGGLRAKIVDLFNFSLDADLMLTYVDEDGDIVTLVDDDDLRDVMRQQLKFLRIDVQLNNDKGGNFFARSSGSSTPLRSPRVQHPLPKVKINTGIAEVLKSVPEPFRETLNKLSLDLASKAASSSPSFADLVECLSKMGQSYLNPASESQVGADSGAHWGASERFVAPSADTNPNVSKDEGLPEVLSKSTSVESSKDNQRVDVGNVASDVEEPVVLLPVYVDLNLEPSGDLNPAGCTTVNITPVASNVPVGNGRKETKKESKARFRGKSVFATASAADTPINLNPSWASDQGLNPFNECPFTGMPLSNATVVPPYPYPRIHPSKRSYNPAEAMAGIFHKGVRCDGCGVHPITGTRFKSKVKEDYDLCSICFSEMGNEADYIQIDRPVSYRPVRSFKGLYDPPTLPHLMRSCGIKQVRHKLDSRFIVDVNVVDGTAMTPSTPFTKIWRMRNNGILAWPRGTQLKWIGGDKFSDAVSVEIEIPADGLAVDRELFIAVDFTAPELPGRYISYWRMASPSGQKFGQRVWVLVQVDDAMKFCDSFQGLNLNLPPYGSGSTGPEIIGRNAQPAVDDNFLEPHSSNAVTEPIKPMNEEQPGKDQELNFPINDTLIVGEGVSAPSPPEAPSRVSYPIIDFSEASPTAPSLALPHVIDVPTSSEGVGGENNAAVELTLLKELEEMGFKKVDLNKEVLRMNDYNLEQSVVDLCGVAEWDPILEELQEMGFCDAETNKRLLKKNNGSIKRVVMDLIKGEKA